MIANEIAFGKSFGENILYNVQGKAAEPNPHKTEWYVAKNMFTDDLDAAGKVMQATASASKATKPVYHFSIDWDRSEERFLSKEKCIEAADKIMEDIGLKDHQALYFWHVDADHPHMHVVANRVNDQGKAWDMWKSKEKLERATHGVAKEMDFMQVPGKFNEMDFEPDKERDASQSRQERATEPDLKPWAKEKIADVKNEIGNAFYHAESWQDLSSTLDEAGYKLQSKGQGLIVTDGQNYTQLSKMGKHVRLNGLEEKFGEKFAEFIAENPLEPKDEKSPVESFDNLGEKIEKRIQQEVEEWGKLESRKMDRADEPSTDTRVAELMTVINGIETFDNNWTAQKSARKVLASENKVTRLEKYLGRAKELLTYHEQKSNELLLSLGNEEQHSDHAKDRLFYAKRGIQKSEQKKHQKNKLLNALKRFKKKKTKEKKKNRKAEWRVYYRLQKIREAQSRIEAQKFEIYQAKAEAKANKKAHEQNKHTRELLATRKQKTLKSLPKQSIIHAKIPTADKKRLLANWYAQNKNNEKEKVHERDIERDPFD